MSIEACLYSVKDDIISTMKSEFSKAIGLIEQCCKSTNIFVDIEQIAANDIYKIKDELQELFSKRRFKITESQCDTAKLDYQYPPTDCLAEVPTPNYLQVYQVQQEVQEECSPYSETNLYIPQREYISPSKIPLKQKPHASMRTVPDYSLSSRPLPLFSSTPTVSGHPSSFSGPALREPSFQPPTHKASASEVFDMAGVEVPDPSDTRFNDFLESELERIKRTFLDDNCGPSKPEKARVKEKKEETFDIRSQSIGQNKVSRTVSNKNSFHNKAGSQPGLKKSITHVSYKEKFEELYYKGGAARKSREEGSKQRPSKSPLVQAKERGLIEVTRPQTDTSKLLSKFAMRPGSNNQTQPFSPLFKGE